jgi:hypothetical protein
LRHVRLAYEWLMFTAEIEKARWVSDRWLAQ